MKSVRHRRQIEREHRRVWNVLAPNAPSTLGSVEKNYLIWGILRLVLGLVQMTFAVAAILCLVFVGLSSTTVTCIAVATIATLVSRTLFRGRRGARR
ncbi:hypothetical protein F6X40_40695 [Paraburkholderia sp. UCT31]|uniref:hypothetical protein n=1 Tax=Paraburkholderia sp. UCT31 TaxID=2615209 RepID=UPI0016560FDD|nr:hypothetical protein [Paraburkholderia sp. UCT31]MBC8742794.1 hypothetical protein [Paraburkholderia sp. UCT31]